MIMRGASEMRKGEPEHMEFFETVVEHIRMPSYANTMILWVGPGAFMLLEWIY